MYVMNNAFQSVTRDVCLSVTYLASLKNPKLPGKGKRGPKWQLTLLVFSPTQEGWWRH